MFLQQADTNSKSLLCLHRKAHSATYEAVGDMPPSSGAQQSMILIGGPRKRFIEVSRQGSANL